MRDVSATRKALKHGELTVCSIFVFHIHLAKPKIAQRNMSRIVQQDVLGLEIPVYDVESMKALQGAKKLSSVESCTVDIEALLPLEMMEKLSTIDECQHKIELLWRLERKLEGDDERIVDLR